MSSKYTSTIKDLHENSSHGKILSSIQSGSTVLECGSASGYMTRYMKERLSAKVSIVELDEEAFQQARQYAHDGVCADLDGTEWYDYFHGQTFDYILFTDVLEHLRNPEEVLKRTVDLLKEDGTIIASVPNVAHADILVNLLNGRWNYTPLGLLDNTHIHFWAEKNLDALFLQAGLSVVEKDYTITPPFQTEQKSEDNTEPLLPAIHTICHQPYADVYQFVYCAKKTAYVCERDIVCTDHYVDRHVAYWIEPSCCSEYQENQNRLAAQHAEREKLIQIQRAQIQHLEEEDRQLKESFDTISNAFFWKITKPLRLTLDAVKRVPVMALTIKGVKSLKNNGWSYTWQKVKGKTRLTNQATKISKQPLFTKKELEQQRTEQFPRQIKFSIVVPLYNTPERFLREMIQSVLEQTYADWELCMADGSDAEHHDVEAICREYAEKDSRIRYRKLDKNYGISGNTNACLEMAQGDYIGLFDHDDLLHPAALREVMKAICEKDADFIYTDENTFHRTPKDAFCPHFKPAFAPDTLRANNYICHFTVFRRSLLEEAGLFRPECDGSQDYDMFLRLTEKAQKIVHIPEILYFWRAHANSVADSAEAKPYVIQASHKALEDHLTRLGLEGEVLDSVVPTMYRIKYAVKGNPLVSILIPNCDHTEDLRCCIESIEGESTYQNFEIIVVENNSKKTETFQYYDEIQKCWDNVKVIQWEGVFNYSAINNFGAQHCAGDYLLLLNNDTEVISPDWMQEMLMFAQRQDVGAVGAKLYYPDDTIQHAGVILGIGGVGGHSHKYFSRTDEGYMGRLLYAQNLSAVTAACVMIRRNVWEQIGGLDESFAVAFNDVDLCMRIRKAGYLIIWTPFAELYHYESKSRGLDDTLEKQRRFAGEVRRFQGQWAKELTEGDPYYNPNLTLVREDFSVDPVVKQHGGREA